MPTITENFKKILINKAGSLNLRCKWDKQMEKSIREVIDGHIMMVINTLLGSLA